MFCPSLQVPHMTIAKVAARELRQVSCGWYLPGRMGTRSLMGRPNTCIAGDNFVSLSRVLRCCRTVCWNLSTSSSPLGPVLLVMSLFMDLTPISARQLLWGKAIELRRWFTPHCWRKVHVAEAINSGPPPDESSSGMP